MSNQTSSTKLSKEPAVLSSKQRSHFFIVISVVAAFAGILFGYDTGVISGAILFISKEFDLSAQMNGVVVSTVLMGAFFGAIISGRISDHIGRKMLLIIDAIVFIIGTTITCFAPTISILIIGRFIVGLAIGVSSYVAPLYISEIAPPKYRGALVSLNQLAITIGIMLSYVIDYFFAQEGGWRWMFLAGVVPAVCLLVGMICLPRSPRWMVAHGHLKKALKILRKIRGDGANIQAEIDEIQKSLKVQKGDWHMLFSKVVRPTVIIGVGLAFFQQVTGINTIVYYAPTIFEMAGFHSSVSAILATMGIGVVFVIFTIIALPMIDTVGRRPLLLWGLVGMAIGLLVLSWAFFEKEHNLFFLRWFTVGGMILYIASFSVGLGPIMWLMISEISPLRLRGLGSSLATCVNWASNWLVALTFLTLVDFISASGTFFVYFVISIIAIFFIYLKVPETKGVTLEQIERNLYAGKHSRQLGRKVGKPSGKKVGKS